MACVDGSQPGYSLIAIGPSLLEQISIVQSRAAGFASRHFGTQRRDQVGAWRSRR
jgi:hypothetical protein